LKLLAVFRSETNSGLDAFLPAAVEEEALLRRKSEIALFPLAIFQYAEIFEEFANAHGFRPGDRHVMRSPGIRGEFVLAPAGVAAGLLIHFKKDKISETAFAETPGGTEASDSPADNGDGDFFDALCTGECGAVAQEMAHLERIVDKRAFNLFFTFQGKADERRTAKTEKKIDRKSTRLNSSHVAISYAVFCLKKK